MYIRYIYGIFGREIAKITAKIRSYTVYIYGSGPPYVYMYIKLQKVKTSIDEGHRYHRCWAAGTELT